MTATDRPFRLNFWMTVCALPALMLLIGLGIWQLQRLDWKEKLIAERAARLARPVIALTALPADDWKSYDLRRVKLTGRFLHDRSFEIVNRTLNGRPGVHIVTPMMLADGGGSVLVNRGWAPPANERRPGEMRLPEGDVVLEGILRTGGRPNPWVPDNEPAKGIWFYTDPPAMARAAGLADARPYVVEAGPSTSLPAYPVGGQTFIAITNNHLQYALTWFALAGALVAIYVLYHVRRRS